jgi:hypothetical protein
MWAGECSTLVATASMEPRPRRAESSLVLVSSCKGWRDLGLLVGLKKGNCLVKSDLPCNISGNLTENVYKDSICCGFPQEKDDLDWKTSKFS